MPVAGDTGRSDQPATVRRALAGYDESWNLLAALSLNRLKSEEAFFQPLNIEITGLPVFPLSTAEPWSGEPRSVVLGVVGSDHRGGHPAGIGDLHPLRASPRADRVGLAGRSDVRRRRWLHLCRCRSGLLGGTAPCFRARPVCGRPLRDWFSCRRSLRWCGLRCGARFGNVRGCARPGRHRLASPGRLGWRILGSSPRDRCLASSRLPSSLATPQAVCLTRAGRFGDGAGTFRLRGHDPAPAHLSARARLLGWAFRHAGRTRCA